MKNINMNQIIHMLMLFIFIILVLTTISSCIKVEINEINKTERFKYEIENSQCLKHDYEI